jgi:uncharacterized protein YndB with AHSA1/START domain
MRDTADNQPDANEIALECQLDAAPNKVWRAITVPAFREQWLPGVDLAEPQPIGAVQGVEVSYRMRDDGASPLESTVTFRIEPGRDGGTLFTVIHRIEGFARAAASANDNGRPRSLAA